MPYFDFHCHPGLKPTFTDQSKPISPWQFIEAELTFLLDIHIKINALFNEALNSQCCLTQLYNGNVKLIGVALHSPEANMAKGLLEKNPVNKGAIALINHDRLEFIKTANHYFELLNDDLNRLKNTASPQNLNGAKFKIIQRSADFNELDTKTIYGFLIVEGLHCFFNDQSAANAKDVFTNNFENFTNTNTVVAINICHLQQNPFCNHAFGIQFINPEYFYPVGDGITPWGHQVLDRMVQKKILVDIKHMSLRTRFQLYQKLRDPADENKYIAPIICTHAGLTGQSMNDRAKYLLDRPKDVGPVFEVSYLKPKSHYIDGVYFNCSSINLYDEDIQTILLSGGLIGLSFDQRILGFADENILRNVTVPSDLEYISKAESKFFLGPNPTTLPLWTDDNEVWTSEDFEDLDPARNIGLHPLFFFNHIIHILVVAQKHEFIDVKKAVKQICLGSDYDGLINSIDNCKQADHLTDFKKLALDKLPGLIAKTDLKNEGINVAELIENIFYSNGKNFILNRLKSIGK